MCVALLHQGRLMRVLVVEQWPIVGYVDSGNRPQNDPQPLQFGRFRSGLLWSSQLFFRRTGYGIFFLMHGAGFPHN